MNKEKFFRKEKSKKSKRAVSPVIASVLLIAIVVVLAAIIFLWARGFLKERVSKFVNGEEVSGNQACSEIALEVAISDTNLDIINRGNIPIYGIELIKSKEGYSNSENFFNLNLASGAGTTVEVSDASDYTSFVAVPIIIGKAKETTKPYTCKDETGFDVAV